MENYEKKQLPPHSSEDTKMLEQFTAMRLLWAKKYKLATVMETITEHALAFEKQHPDARDYKLFHILIGSTPPPHVRQIDGEGEDSVRELFMQIDHKLRGMDVSQ